MSLQLVLLRIQVSRRPYRTCPCLSGLYTFSTRSTSPIASEADACPQCRISMTSLVMASTRRLYCSCGVAQCSPCDTRHHLDGRGAGRFADHRFEVRASLVLRAVGVVDAVTHRSFDWCKGNFLRDARSSDSTRLLLNRGSVPTPAARGTRGPRVRHRQPRTKSTSARRTSCLPRETARCVNHPLHRWCAIPFSTMSSSLFCFLLEEVAKGVAEAAVAR